VEDAFATIVVVLVAWLIYLLPGVLLCLPICYLGRKRAQFMPWELSVFVLPFTAWLILFSMSKDKTLGNLVEAAIIGGVIPLAAIIRVLLGKRVNRILLASSLITLQCVFAILLGKMFPDVSFQWFH
jgi:hypothetical protein